MTKSWRWIAAGLAVAAVAAVDARAQSAPHAKKVGVELDGVGDGGRARPFVDLARTLRGWTKIQGEGPAPTDAKGWPTTDARTVLFDIRPVFAWAPPIDDPEAYQPDWSGPYPFAFHGRAEVAVAEGPGCRVEMVKYDEPSNTTTGRIVVPRECGILVVSFTKTRRDAEAPEGSGITALRIIRPGYPADAKQVFTNEFLRSLRPFAVLRYMDWLETNHNPGFYGDAGRHALEWADRRPADYATQAGTSDGKYGVAWEYIAALANETGKDLWINVPVAATDGYVRELAKFLKAELKPGLKLYVEHSNEVWNFGFPQYIYNKLAAIDEVERGGSPLNADGSKDQEAWAHRRHAKRLVEIGRTFRETFGADQADRILPVYASWAISPKAHYADVLDWVKATYGEPREHFHALADASYYNVGKAAKDASPEQLVAAMRASSDANLAHRMKIREIADRYGVKHFQYEIGPDVGGGDPTNVGNRILANRLPAMESLLLHDAVDNWFDRGGDLYMYFAHISAASRYGCWGLSEDVDQLDTPKWRAIYKLTGTAPPDR
ncbi:hypothetical protein [Planctomyces sp. SH-PL62]|uniref:hypothetical protein n=1 Tax=Planctomyces sp. SH-PL62 TaxID=1636152 RepID=UPI00078E44ED|nr:hypothetical protein [Planctomyces sp. SH-PL62]AMV40734.1 hypothetical protein VT85_25100 [Planctomyces sp. SH-PL62]